LQKLFLQSVQSSARAPQSALNAPNSRLQILNVINSVQDLIRPGQRVNRVLELILSDRAANLFKGVLKSYRIAAGTIAPFTLYTLYSPPLRRHRRWQLSLSGAVAKLTLFTDYKLFSIAHDRLQSCW
jgi:hypothetical protein